MARIEIVTWIDAPIEICFDLARSIDFHMKSTSRTGETAVAGRTSGLIEYGESVTWRARHLGIWQTLTSKITEFDEPRFFVDEQMTGAFKKFRHEHNFEAMDGKTRMVDTFDFESPLGPLGKLAEFLFLTRYMESFLRNRCNLIKLEAESLAHSTRELKHPRA
ncbi:MAG: SRPBCC family protein [Armatimonadetes bacterium]|nr:SRPBCC family protein [Armatimonadota bacterium]